MVYFLIQDGSVFVFGRLVNRLNFGLRSTVEHLFFVNSLRFH